MPRAGIPGQLRRDYGVITTADGFGPLARAIVVDRRGRQRRLHGIAPEIARRTLSEVVLAALGA